MSLPSASQIWISALGSLEVQVSQPSYKTWLKNTVGLSWNGQHLLVGVPSVFVAEWLEKRMSTLLETTVTSVTGKEATISFSVTGSEASHSSNSLPPSSKSSSISPQPYSYQARTSYNRLNDKYTLDSFVVGESNQLAYAAAVAVASKPGQTYNPLFLYSGVGLGKTHLLHAIGNTAVQRGLTCLYVTSEQFTNEFISSIQNRKTPEFRDKYRSVDVLLVDDIQFIRGKDSIQEGFFHTFNDLHTSNSQIVIASDRPPSELTLLEDRLKSRFEWGLTTVMGIPNTETRVAILQAKAASIGMPIGQDLLYFLAENFHSSVRDLEGALNRVSAYIDLTGQNLSLMTARQALGDLLSTPYSKKASPTDVLTSVCSFYGTSLLALSSKRRDKTLAYARQIAAFLLRDCAQITLLEIGALLGNRDHSSIRYSIKTLEKHLSKDTFIQEEIQELRATILLTGQS